MNTPFIDEPKLKKSDQLKRLYDLLASKEWVTLPEILNLRIASYTRRISDLREWGFNIECKTEWVNGIRQSRYRMIP